MYTTVTTTAFTSFVRLALLVTLGFTYTILFVHGLSASAVAKSNNAFHHEKMIPNNQVDVCIIGAGPVGLATAITLSKPPHNYNCIVIEAETEVKLNSFNPRKGYTYNVNPRGRSFTRQYPEIDDLLQKSGVASRGVEDVKRFCLIPSDPNEPLPEMALQASNEMMMTMEGKSSASSANENSSSLDDGVVNKNDTNFDKDDKAGIQQLGKGGLGKEGYWIQRHELSKVLRDYCLLQAESSSDIDVADEGSITILSGLKCIDVKPTNTFLTSNGEKENNKKCGVDVVVENVSTKEKINFQCNLVVGADGMRSKVCTDISTC